MKSSRVVRGVVLLGSVLALLPRLHAGDWFAETSALYFTDDKRAGVAVGVGSMTADQHYFGAELIYYSLEESLKGPGYTANTKSTIAVSGVTYKYFTPLTSAKKIYGYFGAGAGLATVSASATLNGSGFMASRSEVTSNNFAWQALAGVELPFSPAVAARFGWRYVGVPSVTLAGVTSSLKSHVIEAGLSFRF